MSPRRILVVCYSRTGRTRQIAKSIATALGADLEEIRDEKDRRGVVGYLRSGFESLLGASTQIERPKHDPASYDLVVIGTPVWSSGVSTPVRTYLWVERERLPRVAFYLTHGGTGSSRVFGQMSALAGKEPIATLALRERQIAKGAYRDALAAFTARCSRAPRRAPRRRERSAPRANRRAREASVHA